MIILSKKKLADFLTDLNYILQYNIYIKMYKLSADLFLFFFCRI